jgi:hypothetical protein
MPAGLPRGMPGIGDEIEGAMQHAPHVGRHSMEPTIFRRLAQARKLPARRADRDGV